MSEKLTIQLHKLKLSELITFCERVLSILLNAETDEVKLHHLVVKFKDALDNCNSSLFKVRTASMGPEIAEADKRRDVLYQALKKALESFVPFGGDKAVAATKLLELFAKYPGFRNLNYSEQTQTMNHLINSLSEPAAKAMIELAGVEDQVELFKDSQLAFLKLFADRQNIDSDLDRIPSASKLKPALVTACRKVLDMVWLMHELEAWNEVYYDLLREVKYEKASGRMSSPGNTTTDEE